MGPGGEELYGGREENVPISSPHLHLQGTTSLLAEASHLCLVLLSGFVLQMFLL